MLISPSIVPAVQCSLYHSQCHRQIPIPNGHWGGPICNKPTRWIYPPTPSFSTSNTSSSSTCSPHAHALALTCRHSSPIPIPPARACSLSHTRAHTRAHALSGSPPPAHTSVIPPTSTSEQARRTDRLCRTITVLGKTKDRKQLDRVSCDTAWRQSKRWAVGFRSQQPRVSKSKERAPRLNEVALLTPRHPPSQIQTVPRRALRLKICLQERIVYVLRGKGGCWCSR